MRFVADLEGGKSLITDHYERVHGKHGLSVGTLPGEGNAYFNFDQTHWARLVNTPSENLYTHWDAFAVGSAALPSGVAWKRSQRHAERLELRCAGGRPAGLRADHRDPGRR